MMQLTKRSPIINLPSCLKLTLKKYKLQQQLAKNLMISLAIQLGSTSANLISFSGALNQITQILNYFAEDNT